MHACLPTRMHRFSLLSTFILLIPDKAAHAARDISFTINRGEKVAIVGGKQARKNDLVPSAAQTLGALTAAIFIEWQALFRIQPP